MMRKQSLEFHVGYIFSKIERGLIQCIKQEWDSIDGEIYVPKLWFGLKSYPMQSADLSIDEKSILLKTLLDTFTDLTSKYELKLVIGPAPDSSHHMLIKYDINKVAKKMTLSEVEEKLGYKIEIVSSK